MIFELSCVVLMWPGVLCVALRSVDHIDVVLSEMRRFGVRCIDLGLLRLA